jgi:hypothetical protein
LEELKQHILKEGYNIGINLEGDLLIGYYRQLNTNVTVVDTVAVIARTEK